MFGIFDPRQVPMSASRVPTMAQIQAGYGAKMPSYETIVPLCCADISVANGKKGSCKTLWPAEKVYGLAAVWWNGSGGSRYFRFHENGERRDQPHLKANWNWFPRDESDKAKTIKIDKL